MLVFVLLFTFGPLPQIVSGDAHWTYANNGTFEWPEKGFKFCADQRQSPINLDFSRSGYSSDLKPVRILVDYELYDRTVDFKLVNTGHSVNIEFPNDLFTMSLDNNTGGDLFQIVGMHFHWGSTASVGSEHQLDGRQYSLEAHIVSFNKRLYKNANEAMSNVNGLAVLGILGQEVLSSSTTSPTSPQFDIIEKIRTGLNILIQTDAKETQVAKFHLSQVLLSTNPAVYYRYAGSLTTPPCTPNVVWTVFNNVAHVSQAQLDLLRQLPLSDNFRPVQPLSLPGGRQQVPRSLWRSFNAANRISSLWSIYAKLSIVLLLVNKFI